MAGGAVSRPAEPRGAFVVVLAISSKRFTVHDPPQRGHPGGPPRALGAARVHRLVRTGPDLRDQRTRTHLLCQHEQHDAQSHCGFVLHGHSRLKG